MKNTLILLAGGDSSRMGQSKGLISIHDTPLLLYQLDKISLTLIHHVILVLGRDASNYFDKIPGLKDTNSNFTLWSEFNLYVKTVINPHSQLGPFSSLQKGLAKIEQESDIFVLPIDVPCPAPLTWEKLNKNNSYLIHIPTYKGKGGHPVKLSKNFIKEIININPALPEARLDFQIKKLPTHQISRIPVEDPKIIYNLNTPQDLKQIIHLL